MNARPSRAGRALGLTLPRLVAVVLWTAGLGLLALRWRHLDADPWPLSWSGDLLTDEGWYSKAALLKARFGHWTAPGDFVPITHNALHAGLLRLAFAAGGVSMVSARAVCLGLYTGGAVALAAAFGRRTGAWPAAGLLLCLVGGHLVAFVYSRLALTDISASGLASLALAAWFAGERVRAGRMQVLAVGLAGAALLCKLSYAPIWSVLLLAAVGRTRPWQGRPRDWALMVPVALAPLVVLLALRLALPDDWAAFQQLNVSGRWPGWAGYPQRLWLLMPRAWEFLGWRALGLALVAGLLVLGAASTARAAGAPRGAAAAALPRVVAAEPWWMPLLWLGGTLGQLALLAYWPWRYMVVLLVPVAWLSTLALLTGSRRLALAPRLRGLVAGGVGLALLASAWGPQYRHWATSPWRASAPQHSFAELARRMRALPVFQAAGTVVVAGGGTAAALALYLPGTEPVDVGAAGDLCRFLVRARARLLVLNANLPDPSPDTRVLACPQLATARLLTSGVLLGNYRQQGATLVMSLPVAAGTDPDPGVAPAPGPARRAPGG